MMVSLSRAVIGSMVVVASTQKVLACCCKAPRRDDTSVWQQRVQVGTHV